MWMYSVQSEGTDCIEHCCTKLIPVIEATQEHLSQIENVSADITTGVFSDNEQLNFYIPHNFSFLLGSAQLNHLISGYITTQQETKRY